MTPAQSLRDSADKLSRAGRTFDASFTRRLAEQATVWPELYAHHAREQAKRADRLSRERGVGNGAPADQ